MLIFPQLKLAYIKIFQLKGTSDKPDDTLIFRGALKDVYAAGQ